MKARTEDQIVSMEPIAVKFGATEYKLPILGINAQRAWREKLSAVLVPILEKFKPAASPNSAAFGLAGALLDFPQEIAKMVFEYDSTKVLDSEKILNEASEEQMATAFSAVMQVAFPYTGQLAMLTHLVRESQRQ